MKVTSVGFKRRMEFATVSLVRMSAPKLVDDTRLLVGKLPYVPLRVAATATIAECLQVKAMYA